MENTAMRDTATAKGRLEAQLVELKGRQTRIARDLAEPLNRDSSEQAAEMEDDDSLKAQAALLAREIASVERALMRIEKGTYGQCVRCGAEIASKRLEARPEAALCFECASQEQR
jgi:RNA polymerase-binding transcription factor